MNRDWIHLNAAGASICSSQVVEAQIAYLKEEQQFGGYLCAERHATEWQALYRNIARISGAKEHQVALVESATRGILNALLAIPWQQGDEVVITELEYGANYVALLQLAQRYHLTLRCVPLADGELKVADVMASINPKTRAVVITWIPSHNGMIAPAEAIGEQLRGFDGYYVVDACQAAGQIAIDFASLNADFLVATGRKFLRAPRGTGFLLVSDRVLQQGLYPMVTDHVAATWQGPQQFTLREDAKRFETWEANWSARMGMSVAIADLAADVESIYQEIQAKAQELRSLLRQLPHIELCDTGVRQSAIISFRCLTMAPRQLKDELQKQRFITSLITLDSGMLDLKRRQLSELNRVSVHTYNGSSEFVRLAEALDNLRF